MKLSAGIFYYTEDGYLLTLLKKNGKHTLPGGRIQHRDFLLGVMEKFENETGVPLQSIQDNPVSIDRHYRVYFVKAPEKCDTSCFVKGKHLALDWIPFSIHRSKCDFILQRAFHLKASSVIDDLYFSD